MSDRNEQITSNRVSRHPDSRIKAHAAGVLSLNFPICFSEMTTPLPPLSSLPDTALDKSIPVHEVEDDYEGEDEATLHDDTDTQAAWSREGLAEASRGVKESTFNKYSGFVISKC